MSETNETSLEAQEELLREQAAEADAREITVDELQESIGEQPGAAADPAEDKTEVQTKQDNPQEDGESGEGDDTNSQVDNADNSPGEGTQNAESSEQEQKQKESSAEIKARKEEARRDRSWKKLEAEKAAFLREKAEWLAQRLNTPAAENPQSETQNTDTLSAAFEEMAKQLEQNGDFDGAQIARERIKDIASKLPPTGQDAKTGIPADAARQMERRAQFAQAWNANIERAINDFPEMKDPESDFGKNVQSILRAPDAAAFISGRPDGIYLAAQLTKMKMTALRVPELEKENAALKEEINKLRQGASIPDSGASERGGEPKSISSMSLSEQEAYFRKQAEIEDASGAPVI